MRIERIQVKDLPDLRDKVTAYPEDLAVLFYEDISNQNFLDTLSFSEDSLFHWPECSRHDFYRRVMNLQQVGNEDLSPARMWDSLKRAAERVVEQSEGMSQAKMAYDALRSEWEAAEERLELQRSIQIKIKRLQAEKDYLSGKIVGLEKIKERLQILRENPDYSELHKLQNKMNRLEQTKLDSETLLAEYSQDPNINWDMIEELKEESFAWAELQTEANVHLLEMEELQRDSNILADNLNNSGYRDLPETEDERLRKAEEELAILQRELEKEQEASSHLTGLIADTEKKLYEEMKKLKSYVLIANATGKDKRRLARIEKQLKYWKVLLAGRIPDRPLKETRGLKKIYDRIEKSLTFRQQVICQKYTAHDYSNFVQAEIEYKNQLQAVNTTQNQLKSLRREATKEKTLVTKADACSQMLRLAYTSVNASGLDEWRRGWAEYVRQKKLLSEQKAVLDDKKRRHEEDKIKLTESVEMLREKVLCWTSTETNSDELLTIIQNIALHLWLRDMATKDYADTKIAYMAKLNKRNMDQLSSALEPFDDLVREGHLSDEERNATVLKTKQQIEKMNIEMQQAAGDLKKSKSLTVDPDLDNRLEKAKQQWQSFQELQQALADTKELLESCMDKWQLEYGIALKIKAKRIFTQSFSLPVSERKEVIMAEAGKYYFAYRQAQIELALEDDLEKPLFFFSGQMNETSEFWDSVLRYYQVLSQTRKVIFVTTDSHLWQYITVNFENA